MNPQKIEIALTYDFDFDFFFFFLRHAITVLALAISTLSPVDAGGPENLHPWAIFLRPCLRNIIISMIRCVFSDDQSERGLHTMHA